MGRAEAAHPFRTIENAFAIRDSNQNDLASLTDRQQQERARLLPIAIRESMGRILRRGQHSNTRQQYQTLGETLRPISDQHRPNTAEHSPVEEVRLGSKKQPLSGLRAPLDIRALLDNPEALRDFNLAYDRFGP